MSVFQLQLPTGYIVQTEACLQNKDIGGFTDECSRTLLNANVRGLRHDQSVPVDTLTRRCTR
jgi:hypothetical protein